MQSIRRAYLIKSHFSELLLSENHNQRRGEDNASMTNVAKHDCKQERESNHCEQTRIGFLVSSDPVTIHNGLKALSESVGSDKRWWGLISSEFIQNGRHAGA